MVIKCFFECINTEKCLVAYHGFCQCVYEFEVKQKDTKIDHKTNYTPNRNWDMLYMTCPKCGKKNTVAFIPNEDDDIDRIIAHNDMIPKKVSKNN